MPRRKARTEAAGDAQPDLFAEGYRVPAPPTGRVIVPADGLEAARKLDDETLFATLRRSSPSKIEPLCSEVVSRSLEKAVPVLEELWRRFVGFGIDVPLREQRAVLRTLAQLDCASARAALKRIVLWKGLPASQLPLALRAAAVALGNRGNADVREALIAELAADPSRAVIEALAAIGGDDAIVHLGRCAERHPALAGAVVDALRDMESPRAERLAGRLEARGRVPGADGA